MDLDETHVLAPTSMTTPSSHASTPHREDSEADISDSDLSQLEAEIEKNLTYLSQPRHSQSHPPEDMSGEPMDIDAEDEIKQINAAKNKRTVAREYYDPELYGLRRSVSTFVPCSPLRTLVDGMTDL
jgi:hypothetical protein